MRIIIAPTLLATLFPPTTTASYSPECGSSSYTGFALQSSSSCKSYVYCQSGTITSTTNCPDGLLFNGGVGRGGICTWPEMVVCDEDEAAGEGDVTTATTTTSTATTTTTTTSSSSSASSNNDDSSSNAALPSPWKQYLDPQSGNYYYHNPITDVTQWARPESTSTLAVQNGSNNNVVSSGGN
eukprot:scaffold295947_cov139-Cyclotella_meneghiniana.AAC.1